MVGLLVLEEGVLTPFPLQQMNSSSGTYLWVAGAGAGQEIPPALLALAVDEPFNSACLACSLTQPATTPRAVVPTNEMINVRRERGFFTLWTDTVDILDSFLRLIFGLRKVVYTAPGHTEHSYLYHQVCFIHRCTLILLYFPYVIRSQRKVYWLSQEGASYGLPLCSKNWHVELPRLSYTHKRASTLF